jgi:hypothetical protein
VLAGDWVPDPRGICRENLENPKPGSEKMGLLDLMPNAVYGDTGQSFAMDARYTEQRPPVVSGTQMDAGLVFGLRDANDFYLLESSALHDIVRVDRYVHGKRRDIRETLVRTHADEWHTLQVQVSGDTVTAGIDGAAVFSVSGLTDTAGGVGLWARTSAASCFAQVQVQVDGANPGTALAPVPGI